MTTFTDESGQKFERVKGVSFMKDAEINHMDTEYLVIRPVKAEPEWLVTLNKGTVMGWHINLDLAATGDQAQLIKDWISAGMEWMNKPKGAYPNYPTRIDVGNALDKARTALREDKS